MAEYSQKIQWLLHTGRIDDHKCNGQLSILDNCPLHFGGFALQVPKLLHRLSYLYKGAFREENKDARIGLRHGFRPDCQAQLEAQPTAEVKADSGALFLFPAVPAREIGRAHV